jgi:hypothetical protein
VYSNIEFIKKHTEINFYIHENDIHKLESKPTTFQRYYALRSILMDLPHVYILAYYWYFYQSLYSIANKNLICFPRFVKRMNLVELNKEPINKILLSGSRSGHYPMRRHVASLNHPNVDILEPKMGVMGENFIKYLGRYLACFTCCLNRASPYIINKFYEILFSGSLLLAYDELVKEPLKSIGFVDGENYISCTKENVVEKINWVCDQKNRKEVDRIRTNGYYFVISNHTDIVRYQSLIKLFIDKPIEEPSEESVLEHLEPIKEVVLKKKYQLYKNLYTNLYDNK